MQPRMAHELNEADDKILALLAEGRNLPQNLADHLDYSRQYVQNRLQMLKAADYVTNLGGGLYELTEEGRNETGVSEEDALDGLLAAVHYAESKGEDELAELIAECYQELGQLEVPENDE